MPEVRLDVTLIQGDKNKAYDIAVKALKICHATGDYDNDRNEKLIKKYAIGLGHESALEHNVFTFLITGISRATSHQLVRKRIGVAYSQKSQRYCKENGFDYILPGSIAKNDEALFLFNECMYDIDNAYAKLCSIGIPKEDARYVLPNACETQVITSMNIRSLRDFFNARLSKKAQWEIRAMAKKMLYIMMDGETRIFFEDIEDKFFGGVYSNG